MFDAILKCFKKAKVLEIITGIYAGQQNLCQTWEWTFSAPWDEMVMKCPPQSCGQVYEEKRGSANWRLTLAIYIYRDYIMATATADFQ